MEKISEEEANRFIEEGKEEIRKIIEEGGKVIRTTIEEKDKITTITKIEPVEGESTSSKVVQTKDELNVNFL